MTYASAGPKPYGGPVVVIIDAGVRSAGETASGMFKEDGRAYEIELRLSEGLVVRALPDPVPPTR